MRKLIFSLLLAFLSVSAFAQTPQQLNYQSVLRNSSDELIVNQQIGLRISILKASVDGDVVYIEVQSPETNSNGLMSIQFGEGSVFESIDWGADIYFLKTQIDPTGGTNYTIEGISQLLSVPYALYAETAKNSVNPSPIEIIASNQYSSTDAAGVWEDVVTIDKPCLLTVNASASGTTFGNTQYAGIELAIELDGEVIAIDKGAEAQPTVFNSLTYHASAASTLFLQPGTYNLKVNRVATNIFNNYRLRVSYFAMYAEQ